MDDAALDPRSPEAGVALEHGRTQDLLFHVLSLAPPLCCSLLWPSCPVLSILQDKQMCPQEFYKSSDSPRDYTEIPESCLGCVMSTLDVLCTSLQKVTLVLKKQPISSCLLIWLNTWFLNIFHEDLHCSLIIYLLIGLICCLMSGFMCMCVFSMYFWFQISDTWEISAAIVYNKS